jgi:hypothetical protein
VSASLQLDVGSSHRGRHDKPSVSEADFTSPVFATGALTCQGPRLYRERCVSAASRTRTTASRSGPISSLPSMSQTGLIAYITNPSSCKVQLQGPYCCRMVSYLLSASRDRTKWRPDPYRGYRAGPPRRHIPQASASRCVPIEPGLSDRRSVEVTLSTPFPATHVPASPYLHLMRPCSVLWPRKQSPPEQRGAAGCLAAELWQWRCGGAAAARGPRWLLRRRGRLGELSAFCRCRSELLLPAAVGAVRGCLLAGARAALAKQRASESRERC